MRDLRSVARMVLKGLRRPKWTRKGRKIEDTEMEEANFVSAQGARFLGLCELGKGLRAVAIDAIPTLRIALATKSDC